jgi:hypothetical protein
MTCFLTKRNAVSPISLHNLLCATGDGFRSSVLCFLLLGLPIVCSALSGVVFCLDFSPFFFLLLFHCQVFLPSFIYLVWQLPCFQTLNRWTLWSVNECLSLMFSFLLLSSSLPLYHWMSTFSLVELMAFLCLGNFSKVLPSNNEKNVLEKKAPIFLRKYKKLRKISWDFHTVFSLGTALLSVFYSLDSFLQMCC